MFLRQNKRRKNGKTHRYFTVVENRRLSGGGTTQRQVLDLGEINDTQQQAWRRTLEVFDEDQGQYRELSLFPHDRPVPPGDLDSISVRLNEMELRRPRAFGDCWLGCWLWERLELSSFWARQLIDSRGDVPWAKVLQLLVVMGISRMTLVDHDTVDVVNLAPQGYTPKDLGRMKVEAMADWCRQINPELELHLVAERFRRSSARSLGTEGRLAVFCCVDSISTRQLVWEGVKSRAMFFADVRMSAEVIRVLASDRPSDDHFYPTTLFAQEEAHVGACTAKSTIYTASIAASLMLCQFTRWLRGLPVDCDLVLNLLASEMTVA